MQEGERQTIIIPESLTGSRLDKALELAAPELGLRARKRLWETHAVLVDGRPRPKGYRVRAGQALVLAPLPKPAREVGSVADWPGLRVIGQKTGRLAAIFKPPGLPSEALAGRPGPSVEAFLPEFWPGGQAKLVNRLDTPTSGIVLVALAPGMVDEYRALERAGRVRKQYYALASGRIEHPIILGGRIDMADRAAVRVLEEEDPDPVRRTHVEPLLYIDARHATLVRVIINRGARHQIRAHLAHAGHALMGDDVYGAGEPGGLYLHHAVLELPGYQFAAGPTWPEWPEWSRAADLDNV